MNHGTITKTTAKGLRELGKRIEADPIPSSTLDESLNIATWNIRHFGAKKRSEHSIHLIAEVLHQFDLIAIIELNRNLDDLRRVKDILGPYWKIVFTDTIMEDDGSNDERIGYLYDSRMVRFTGLAAEADPPRTKNKKTGEYETLLSWWRPPFLASFKAGSFDFVMLAVHIRWAKYVSNRKAPIQLLADWVVKKSEDPFTVDKDIIVLGDFNIPSLRSSLYKILKKSGLQMPKKLAQSEFGSNLEKNKRYDQILHLPRNEDMFSDHGGVLDFYTGGIKKLYPHIKKMSKSAFTHQMSDHLPLWIQLDVNTNNAHIDSILSRKK